ncbi:hypothetical protein BAE44_0009841 [Dichanthelium oligosanthes]|uniref:Uncharacterized protein n=1 Tax=Dichanthelium oligosanthes TaxID=888268 RepID=A0A1E5VVI5_9POAL|nr:hypothetical protein BAE44_0009841 [Dichanthelium oligosanthes]
MGHRVAFLTPRTGEPALRVAVVTPAVSTPPRRASLVTGWPVRNSGEREGAHKVTSHKRGVDEAAGVSLAWVVAMDPVAESNAAVPPPGAVAVTVAAAAPAQGARRAAARPARSPPGARVALATVLFFLGCTAAALAFFAMTLHSADSRILVRFFARNQTASLLLLPLLVVSQELHDLSCDDLLPCCKLTQGQCAPTDEEAAGLRAASVLLLLAASAQVLAAAAALLVPATPLSVFGCALGWLTAYRAMNVVWMLVACHGRVHGALAFHFWFFFAVLLGAQLVGSFAAIR